MSEKKGWTVTSLGGRLEVVLPSSISLKAQGRPQLLQFLRDLRSKWDARIRYVQLVVSDSVSFSVEGLALLCAELHELVSTSRAEILVHATDFKARALGDIIRGISDSNLNLAKQVRVEASDGTNRIFLVSGQEVLGEAFAFEIDPYVKSLGSLASRRMYEAVIEAMANSLEHAYKEARFPRSLSPRFSRRWWFAGVINQAKATLAIVDLGVGIPRTFRGAWSVASPELDSVLKEAARLLHLSPDADPLAILAAWKQASTSTFSPGRGRGFLQICEVAKVAPGALVSVLSNKGLFVQRFEEPGRYTLFEFPDSVFGTITAWELPFGSGR